MRNLCIIIRWLTFGLVCLGHCKKEICAYEKGCTCKNCSCK